jgi:ADP-ribose pyrophosphatase YjhB (NUDIX family)
VARDDQPAERALDDAELEMLAGMGRGVDGRSTDIASGQGAPRWVSRTLNFCSNCGTRLVADVPATEQRERAVCPACGFIAYVNPRVVVTTIPVTDSGEAILLRRGIEPGYGAWAQPGGFLEVDETVGEAAVRETLEETGLLVEPTTFVGLYSRLEAAVVVLVFEARIVGGAARETPEALEIQAFRPDALPWDGLAFKTTYWALRDWAARHAPDAPLPDAFRGWESSPGRARD